MAIAESFELKDGHSVYAGVVARRDGVIEGAALATATLGGTDGTDAAVGILEELMRPDISLVMLDGCIVSFYNWIDGAVLWEKFGTPVACYIFEEPEGKVEEAARKLFGDWEARVSAFKKLGEPAPYYSRTGYKIYVRAWGIDPLDAGRAAELCTKFGKVPEPIRAAKVVADAARRFMRKRLKYP